MLNILIIFEVNILNYTDRVLLNFNDSTAESHITNNYQWLRFEHEIKPDLSSTTILSHARINHRRQGVADDEDKLIGALRDTRDIRVITLQQMLEWKKDSENIAKEMGFWSKELIEAIAEQGSLQEIAEIPEDIKRTFTTAHDISPLDHITMQAAFQKYTDNAVSKTINLPNKARKKDVERAFMLAYELGCKGVTVFRYGASKAGTLILRRHDQNENNERDD